MSLLPVAHHKNMSEREHAELRLTHIRLGHYANGDIFLANHTDRHSGTYIIGVPGSGKSGLLQNLVAQDIRAGKAVIVFDPHGDLVHDIIAQAPQDKLHKIHLLDMADEQYPFGVNLFAVRHLDTAMAWTQNIDRITHVFNVLWRETESQQNLPRYLRAAIITLLSNSGSTLADMLSLLRDVDFRESLLKNVKETSVVDFWQSHSELSEPAQRQQVGPLVNRLESILMGRSIVRNIVSQRETSIDFRKVIEERQVLLINLPVKTLTQDAKLLGTILMSQIHAAIFSFADTPLEQRPEASLVADEFQNFITPDFGEFFTEARKYNVMLTIAHQHRDQLHGYLKAPTMTARTKVIFRVIHDDGSELGNEFAGGETEVRPEDIEPHPVDYLLRHGSDDPAVQTFIREYLLPLSRKGSGDIVIAHPGFRPEVVAANVFHSYTGQPITVADPTHYLNHLLYEAMKRRDDSLPIPSEIISGFSNFGRGFYPDFRYSLNKGELLSCRVVFPPYLVVDGTDRLLWTRPPESGKEQLYHFLFHLRMTISHLARDPIGKKSTVSSTEVAHMLTQLPKRVAFVCSGEDIGAIYTDDTLPPVSSDELQKRLYLIRGQTRAKYCQPVEGHGRDNDVPKQPDEEPPTSRWEEVE